MKDKAPVIDTLGKLLNVFRLQNIGDKGLTINVDVKVMILMDNLDSEWEPLCFFHNSIRYRKHGLLPANRTLGVSLEHPLVSPHLGHTLVSSLKESLVL